jgi:ubiquinone/menaquinone biosynthesis C-methylase UbiE
MFDQNMFDVVVFEYLPRKVTSDLRAATEALAVLKPKGRLVLRTFSVCDLDASDLMRLEGFPLGKKWAKAFSFLINREIVQKFILI